MRETIPLPLATTTVLPHSSTLAWKIPWMEEPGGLQSMGLLRVSDFTSLFTFMHWRRKWQPTPVFLSGESQGRGSVWAAIYGVAQSQTRLKRLSSSSSSSILYWCFSFWLTSLCITGSSFIHLIKTDSNAFF